VSVYYGSLRIAAPQAARPCRDTRFHNPRSQRTIGNNATAQAASGHFLPGYRPPRQSRGRGPLDGCEAQRKKERSAGPPRLSRSDRMSWLSKV
jgi:hypothetical protein